MDRLITVVDRVPLSRPRNGHPTPGVLQALRETVTVAMQEHPELVGCELHDVGLSRCGDAVEVTLYFHP